MAALIGTVLLASLLGSLHCAAMCGAFAAFAALPAPDGPGTRLRQHLAYNGGRLVVYVSLGAFAGALGRVLDVGGAWLGVQRAAAVAAGAVLIGAGLIAALRLLGVRLPSLSAAPVLGRWIRAGHAAALNWPPVLRALAVGLLTALLPCGWLWAFVVTAAGTGSALLGALTMAAFWVGTVPVLAAIGSGAQRLAGLVGRRTQLVACLAVIALGVLALAGRWQMPTAHSGHVAPRENPPGCEHDH